MKPRYVITAIGCLLFMASVTRADVITLTPYLSVSEEYTDNRDLSDTDPIEERSTVISPGIVQSITGKHGGWDLSYTAGYVTYHETEEEDASWRHNAALRIWADPAKHTSWDFRGGYVRTDEDLNRDLSALQDETSPVEPDTTVRKGRNLYETGTASTSLTQRFGEQDAVTLSYLYSTRGELEVEDGNDNKRHSPALDISWWMTPRFGMDMSAIYTNAQFDNSDDYEDWQGLLSLRRKLTRHLEIFLSHDQMMRRYETGTDRNYDTYAPSAGISYQVEKDISLSLGGGYFYQDMKEGENEGGLFANAAIDKSWSSSRSSARLTGSAGLDRNEFGTENLGLERFYGLSFSASYSLTRHFYISLDTAFRRNEYLNTDDDREDNRGQAGCSLGLTPLPWLSISIAYSHNLLRSSLEQNDYDENVGLLTVRIFPGSQRFDSSRSRQERGEGRARGDRR